MYPRLGISKLANEKQTRQHLSFERDSFACLSKGGLTSSTYLPAMLFSNSSTSTAIRSLTVFLSYAKWTATRHQMLVSTLTFVIVSLRASLTRLHDLYWGMLAFARSHYIALVYTRLTSPNHYWL